MEEYKKITNTISLDIFENLNFEDYVELQEYDLATFVNDCTY